MKELLLSVLVSAIPYWLTSAVLGGSDDEGAAQVARVVVVAEAGEAIGAELQDGEQEITVSVGAGGDCLTHLGAGADGLTKLYVTASADAGPAERKVTVRKIRLHTGSDANPDAGWLGVSIGTVSDALAAQLGIEGRGVRVLNVVEGSPAEKAGLKVHDVILSTGGEAVEGADADARIPLAIGQITSHKPGDVVDIGILRDGQEMTLQVTLGTRADMGGMEWKFAWTPDTEVEETIQTFGKILRRGPNGEWIVNNLGELEEFEDLPENILKLLPKSGCNTTQIVVDGQKTSISCSFKGENGEVLTVERKDGGEITVRRVDTNDNETKAVYADDEALRQADEEAYELYNRAGGQHVIHLNIDGLGALEDLDIDLGDLKGHALAWKTQVEDGLHGATEAYEQAMEQLREVMEQWKDGDGASRHLLPTVLGLPALPESLHLAKPKHTFEVREDGRIEVRIRKGDSELVQLFSNEDDLAERNPTLFDKYQDLMADDD